MSTAGRTATQLHAPLDDATARENGGSSAQRPPDEANSQCDASERLFASRASFTAATHDLKAPLTGLSQWIDTLDALRPRLSSGADARTVALLDEALTEMNALVRRSVHLVDELLDVTRAEAGRPLPFAPREVDLIALVSEALEERPETTHHLLFESAEAELWGWWDADRLARLLENLLDNALKYSPADGPITVRVTQDHADAHVWAVLEVEDRGIGIPDGELPHIFEPFHRATNAASATGGNGLGLWSGRRIVEQHRGTLTLASREGEGTTVTVGLPLSQ